MPETTSLPLQRLRVLDLSYVFAVPYIGALLSDLGAEVTKVEAPHRLDLTRGVAFARYVDNDPGPDPWNRSGVFHVLNRGKKSLALDLNAEEGRQVFVELLKQTDIVLDNFTPRVLRKWGFEYEALQKINPSLIMLSNTGYGSGGPWSEFPSQGTTLEATMGITQYTGYRDDKPWKVGQSYPDFLATWTGLLALMAALAHRRRTGQGQWIDLGMYQVGAALVAEPILQHQIDGTDLQRWGNEDPEHVPSNLYAALGEDRWVAISVTSDAQWQALSQLMGQPGLAHDGRYATPAARCVHRDAVNRIVAAWVQTQSVEVLVDLLQGHGIACGPVLSSRDLMGDPQMRHRGFYEWVRHPDPIGCRPLIGRPFRFRRRELRIQGPAPRFGQHTHDILKERLGLSESDIDRLMASAVVADQPLNPGKGQAWDLAEGLRQRTLAAVDADYLTRLYEQAEAPKSRKPDGKRGSSPVTDPASAPEASQSKPVTWNSHV